ncbi:hypothetical protein ACFQ7F_20705 [Streptomyces sp. NPDC056486]|uniref:hypothetical protein n=1 Tax=Streptomyces sp. NPDC056486 TaxID=3345835 RepID=UPI0036C2EC03
MPSFEITPIGTVRNDRTDVQHTDNWGAVRSTITVDERFGEACLRTQALNPHETKGLLDRLPGEQ